MPSIAARAKAKLPPDDHVLLDALLDQPSSRIRDWLDQQIAETLRP